MVTAHLRLLYVTWFLDREIKACDAALKLSYPVLSAEIVCLIVTAATVQNIHYLGNEYGES